jgi:2-C-methyl-D-erythritol 4-phosphate cytidylyltransferase
MITAIIVAAGSSRRMGFDKLFALLAGKPVIAHSIAAFEQCKQIDEILIVSREERMKDIEKAVKQGKFAKVKKIVAGGAERHVSVWNGLQAVSAETSYVAIHDGARPLVTPDLIEQCINLAMEKGAVSCSAPIPDTVKRASNDQEVTESVERSGLWAMQTPQVFNSGLILQAYASLMAKNEQVTDEVSAVQKLGKKIALLRNDDWNLKITFPRDLEMAEHILAIRDKKNPEKTVKTAKAAKPKK